MPRPRRARSGRALASRAAAFPAPAAGRRAASSTNTASPSSQTSSRVPAARPQVGGQASTARTPSAQSSRPLLPRGLTTNAALPLDEALLACMEDPAVLIRTSTGRVKSWVIATGTMGRWGLLTDRRNRGEDWRREGAHLARAEQQAVRARLISSRRAILHNALPDLAWQTYTLGEAFGRVPSGLSVEASAVCLWWLHQRQAGATPEAASMLLNLTLDTSSARRFRVDEQSMLAWDGAEVVYTAGRRSIRARTASKRRPKS